MYVAEGETDISTCLKSNENYKFAEINEPSTDKESCCESRGDVIKSTHPTTSEDTTPNEETKKQGTTNEGTGKLDSFPESCEANNETRTP